MMSPCILTILTVGIRQEYRAFDHVRLSAVRATRMQSGVSPEDRHTFNVSHETLNVRPRLVPHSTRTAPRPAPRQTSRTVQMCAYLIVPRTKTLAQEDTLA